MEGVEEERGEGKIYEGGRRGGKIDGRGLCVCVFSLVRFCCFGGGIWGYLFYLSVCEQRRGGILPGGLISG